MALRLAALKSRPARSAAAVVIAALVIFVLTMVGDDEGPPADEPGVPDTTASRGPVEWTFLSSDEGDLPAPTADAAWQMALVVADVDGEGSDDFVVATAQSDPQVEDATVVLYRRESDGWVTYPVERGQMSLEAGGAAHDVDGDGDLDVVFGENRDGAGVFWWENPSPEFDQSTPWARHVIKDSGPVKHHDMAFGDVDGDGAAEFVFWNQGLNNTVNELLVAEIPDDPTSGPWPTRSVYRAEEFSEGLVVADVDLDGTDDVVAGGHWFRHTGGGAFERLPLRPDRPAARYAVADLIEGGRAEVVVGSGDGDGPLEMLSWEGGAWKVQALPGGTWRQAHSLDVGDVDGDGHLDLFAAEMHAAAGGDARALVLYGDGKGGFEAQEVSKGVDHHESKLADVDGDGDLDIVGKPWRTGIPAMHVWRNDGGQKGGSPETTVAGDAGSASGWVKHVIDDERPARAIFVRAGDIDGDDDLDLVAGGVWYRNPGRLEGTWERKAIGEPFGNVAVVHDLDGDGDLDLLGTQGQGSEDNAELVWARNDGGGAFTVFDNIPAGRGDFLQGALAARFDGDGPLEVALSWHDASVGLEMLTVPTEPSNERWQIRRLSGESQGEDLDAGDVDDDGDLDLLLGTKWLRNNPRGWKLFTLFEPKQGGPDRVRLADVNGNGRLDAVVGYEQDPRGTVAWYEQPADPRKRWAEHVIAHVTSPHSVDVADLDGDGDLDVVVGEHTLDDPSGGRAFFLENADGVGGEWRSHQFDAGEEHHDGMQLADLDGDGDLDAFSIGWNNPRVLVYANVRRAG